jgi:TRAP-type C4-dicarboxylate transport system substrate-binding protein
MTLRWFLPLLFLFGYGVSATAEPVLIRISTQNPITAPTSQTLRHFKERVEAQSDGEIQVAIYDVAKLYSDREVAGAVEDGRVEMGFVVLSRYAQKIPAADVFQLPFVFNSDVIAAAARAPGSDIRQLIDKAILEKVNARVLWWLPQGQNVLISESPLTDPDSLAGKKVRTFGPMMESFVRHCGGQPQDISSLAQEKALESRSVDVGMTGVSIMMERKLWRFMHTITRTNHAQIEVVVVMNEDFWQRLSERHKAIVRSAAIDADEEGARLLVESESTAYKMLTENNLAKVVSLSTDEVQLWRFCSSDVLTDFLIQSGHLGHELMLAYGRLRQMPCCNKAFAKASDHIKSKGKLVVGVKADYPPYGFRDKKGQIVGFEPDLAADLAKRLGVSLEFVPVLSSNRIEFLRDGKVDLVIGTLSITDDRRKAVGIIDPPYYASGVGILAKQGVRLTEASQLAGRTICTVDGNIFLIDLRSRAPGAKTLTFRDIPSAEQALFEGRCEGLFFNDNLLFYKKQSERDRFQDYDVLQLIDITPLLWGIAVKLGEEQSDFGKFVSQAIVDWHRSGFLLSLERKWLGSNTGLLKALNLKWTSNPTTMTNAARMEFGTSVEAKAMIQRVIDGMKVDQTKTLTQINKGESSFRDRDLYPYCIGPDGKYVAHPDRSRIGLLYKEARDTSGKAYGEEASRLAAEGKISEVSYIFPHPTDGTPTQKIGLFTKVAGYICVVSYYK